MRSEIAAPCERLAWDTEFFGLPIARVCGDTLTPERVESLEAWCREERVRCLYFLARADDPLTTRCAEDAGFRLVDVRMTFARSTAEPMPHGLDGTATTDVRIRPARREDVDSLRNIARAHYQDSRFYYDERFPQERSEALYETWIVRSYEGFADAVLIAESDGRPVGFVTCHAKVDGRADVGRIGLVGVSEQARGQGIGQALMREALAWFDVRQAPRVMVVTQGRNCAAQRFYQRCGFLIDTVQLWYHKWYAP